MNRLQSATGCGTMFTASCISGPSVMEMGPAGDAMATAVVTVPHDQCDDDQDDKKDKGRKKGRGGRRGGRR